MSHRVLYPAPISLVRPDYAAAVIAPAYDSTQPAERAEILAAEPLSYLGVTRSPEDFPPGAAPSTTTLMRDNRVAFERLLAADVFEPKPTDTMYCYRLTDGEHAQTGLVCEVDLADYRSGRIRTHEGVRPSRVRILERHLEEVRATSSPVALTFPRDPSATAAIEALADHPPDLEYHAPDGVIQQVWRVDAASAESLARDIDPASLVVVDGHHRLAAAAALAARRNEPAFRRALVVVFPPEELQVFAFHRHVAEPTEAELERLDRVAVIDPTDANRPPLERGSFGLYRDGAWSRIVPVHRHRADSAVDRLDVVSLHRDLLDPAFGLGVESSDPRLATVAGPIGRSELEARVDALGGLGFGLAPITMEELFAVAAQGAPMPAKSSFFWPKARSGMFLRRR